MFRFTIRELLILTVTAALAVGWWIDHRQYIGERAVLRHLEMTRIERDEALRRLEVSDATALRYGKLARAFELELIQTRAATTETMPQ